MLKTLHQIWAILRGSTFFCGVNLAQTAPIPTEVQRIAYYRDLAVQFRGWAEDETNKEARDRFLEMAQQYERLASQGAPKS